MSAMAVQMDFSAFFDVPLAAVVAAAAILARAVPGPSLSEVAAGVREKHVATLRSQSGVSRADCFEQ